MLPHLLTRHCLGRTLSYLCIHLVLFILLAIPLQAATESKVSKKVFIVHSYEPGQVCGQPQADGILKALSEGGYYEGKNLEVAQFFMDTKQTYTTKEQIDARGAEALAKINEFQPDVVVVIDDNSARTVMLPLAGTTTPVVFCGMNNQPEKYNRMKKFMENRKNPGANITGVYEKLHVTRSLDVMYAINKLKKAAIIVDASPSGDAVKIQVEKEIALSDSPVELTYHQVATFEEFKRLILRLNDDPDIGAIYPVAVTLASTNQTPITAKEIFTWLLANSTKPEMSVNYFFSRLGMFGGAAVDFFAMGKQAGAQVVAILNGTPAGDIPIEDAKNQALIFNLERAKQLNIEIPLDILSAADILYDKILLKRKDSPYRLLIIQSYEKNVGCGATIENGFLKGMGQADFKDGHKLDLFHYYMNTQLTHITEGSIREQGKLALAEVYKLDPDMVLLLDDNAFEQVLPSLVGSKYPVLFGGTNVPLEQYNSTIGFMNSRKKPGKNVTGVTEEHELVQSLRLLKSLVPEATTGVVIYSNATPFITKVGEANEAYIKTNQDTLPIQFIPPVWVSSYADYQEEIQKYNRDPSVDIIYSFAPISLTKDTQSAATVKEAIEWTAANQEKPGITWMTNWVPLGYLASAGIDLIAAGNQIATKAIRIINGVSPGALAIENPSEYSIALNLERAKKLGITIPVELLEAAESVCPSPAESTQ